MYISFDLSVRFIVLPSQGTGTLINIDRYFREWLQVLITDVASNEGFKVQVSSVTLKS